MRHTPTSPRNVSIAGLISLLVLFAAGPAVGGAPQAPVGLGAADSYAVLAGETITNTGATVITGDVGLHPGTATPGLTAEMVSGEIHVDDAEALAAKNALVTAYNDAAGRTPATAIATELGGQILTGGVYSAGAFGITGTLTLDGENNPDTVFIFQMESTLTTAVGSSVVLINNAQACNVYWQVGSSADLFSNTTFIGTILALTSINLQNGASIEGRALARNGEVTMDTNTITRATCSSPTNGGTTTTTLTTPVGGVGTGGGSTSGAQSMILVLAGFSLLAVAVGVFEVRRRLQDRRSG